MYFHIIYSKGWYQKLLKEIFILRATGQIYFTCDNQKVYKK